MCKGFKYHTQVIFKLFLRDAAKKDIETIIFRGARPRQTGRTVIKRCVCVPHNGSSPCGPTIFKAAHCAAFGFLGRRRGRQGHRGSGQQPVDQRLLVIVEWLILVELVGGRDQRLALDLTPTVTIDMPKVLQRLQVAVL